MQNPSQKQMFYAASRKAAEADIAFMDMVNHPTNPMTREDLEALIKRRPEKYGRYKGFLDKLQSRA